MKFKDHFSGHAGDYAKFRPTYPEAMLRWLAGLAPAGQIVWECGCGSGQASRQLAEYFPSVIATDASAEQIARAHGPANIDFRVAAAERCGLDEASVDLICVAQALHWFDTGKFFEEALRVARPGAILAAWTYGSARIAGVDHRILAEFEHGEVGSFWPPERSWIDQGYAGVQLPGRMIVAPVFEMTLIWSLDTLLGYTGSWSATHRFRAATGTDPLPGLRRSLEREWGDPARPRVIEWPLTVLASRL